VNIIKQNDSLDDSFHFGYLSSDELIKTIIKNLHREYQNVMRA